MKKTLVFCIILLTISVFLAAQEESYTFETETRTWGEALAAPEKPPFRLQNRMVELSFTAGLNVSNNVFSTRDIFLDPLEMARTRAIFKNHILINIEDFLDGVAVHTRAFIKPLSLNFNWKDNWGVGLDIAHTEVIGNVSAVTGRILTLEPAEDETFGFGGAVFTDVGIPAFFHVNDFKVQIRPSAYLPLVYTEPSFNYTYTTHNGRPYVSVDYDVRIYSLVDLGGNGGISDLDIVGIRDELVDSVWNIASNNLGFDFTLGAEYPVKFDLDVGLNLVNIPIPFAVAKLNYYSQLQGNAYFDGGKIDLADLMEEGIPDDAYDYPDDIEFEYGNDVDGKKIYRPFRALLYANYRPFESQILSFIPSFGFSINYIYPEVFSFEGGLDVRLDLANIYIVTLGMAYTDRVWKNAMNFTLNLRAFEFDFGVSTQSPQLSTIYKGYGLGVHTGVKIGW